MIIRQGGLWPIWAYPLLYLLVQYSNYPLGRGLTHHNRKNNQEVVRKHLKHKNELLIIETLFTL